MNNLYDFCYIGIDNGSTGTIGVIKGSIDRSKHQVIEIHHVPTFEYLGYQKVGQMYRRVDVTAMRFLFSNARDSSREVEIVLEKPYTSNMASKAVYHAAYAYEAMLIAMEDCQLTHKVITAQQWQKRVLGTELKGKELKKASLLKAKQIFPTIDFKGFTDADGLLIAHYAYQNLTPF